MSVITTHLIVGLSVFAAAYLSHRVAHARCAKPVRPRQGAGVGANAIRPPDARSGNARGGRD